MNSYIRLAMLTLIATAALAGSAYAGPIAVAEFRWDSIVQPGIDCPAGDPICVPEDPVIESIFSLTNIWDGPAPGVTLIGNEVSLPGGLLDLFDLAPFGFDQRAIFDLPVLATISTSFLFDGELRTLRTTLDAPDTSAVLRFDPPDAAPVPEPATLALFGLGLTVIVRRARR